MNSLRRLVALCLLGALSLPACASTKPSAAVGDASPQRRADMAGAGELRALKRQAGIQPCPPTAASAAPVAGGLPAVTLPCLGGGRPVDLGGLRGTPTVLNVWAQWCGPCRDEIPLFVRLHRSAGDEIRILGVDLQDPNAGMALAFAAQTKMRYPQLQDLDRAVPDALRVRGIPLTLFVAANGRLAYAHQGAITSMDQLHTLVRRHLGVRL